MSLENSIRLLAGTLVTTSLILGYLISPYWFLLTAFVGVNLIQSSFTRFCPAEMILSKLFYKK
ncbi:MAG: DUF2892 domain-containing protein [Candidatus Zixiibacteriota bacterium]